MPFFLLEMVIWTGKCKLCDIYSRMYSVYGKYVSIEKCLQMRETYVCTYDPESKYSLFSKTLRLFGKEKAPSAVVSNDNDANGLLSHKTTHHF